MGTKKKKTKLSDVRNWTDVQPSQGDGGALIGCVVSVWCLSSAKTHPTSDIELLLARMVSVLQATL